MPHRRGSGDDIELGNRTNPTDSVGLGLGNFFKRVQDIDKEHDKLNKLLKKLQDAHEESKAVTKTAAIKELCEQEETWL